MIKDFKEYISSSLNEKREERLSEIKKEIAHSLISEYNTNKNYHIITNINGKVVIAPGGLPTSPTFKAQHELAKERVDIARKLGQKVFYHALRINKKSVDII